ncbi:glycoside hydrolase family 37 protein [Coniophora puteana RWD-64-598 SS2]|uniref:Trehalase n=1 Tax=Coniophora puteana (strain RWD-64-598) TaxID=741705 RepID=R7SED8_CONPW|nr:glycoside hydrolase family 37 protein [Coniophora puteana RWD-64-598 SS2]EIW74551.1 glycoside hydrolase family 37 protein [Coniophora puteana RWD-64-598 SS2]
MRTLTLLTAAHLVHLAFTSPTSSGPASDADSVTTTTFTTTIHTGVPVLVYATESVCPRSAPLDAPVPSQAALPPPQDWCIGEIFCPGELLQTINVAHLFSDPKTFVDRPTLKSYLDVLADFYALKLRYPHLTEADLVDFVNANFRGEGQELEGLTLHGLNPHPPFVDNVSDPLVRAFSLEVNGFWTQLAREENVTAVQGGLCPVESTFIPLKHPFVIPGGRFREQYYWDSYWIIQGLLQSGLYDTVNDTLQNFMSELECFGFIPNGGRTYYLNRSQPPLFIHMLYDYVTTTNDNSILERALPLAEVELAWWQTHRSVQVTSPFTNKTYSVARFAVHNTAPRPESYLTDYQTVHDPALPIPLTTEQAAEVYSELASGAETGWDYSGRFEAIPAYGSAGLRSLNVRNTIPVDLNSILYKAHLLLADLYDPANMSAISSHQSAAAELREAILDLHWDADKLAFYDFNLTSNSRNSVFSMATFYPIWCGIIPSEVLESEDKAFGHFAAINMVMERYNGTMPATFLDWTGQQWDAPDAWPPHQYIILQALRALPSNITSSPAPSPPPGSSSYALVPAGQLNMSEADLPSQPILGTSRNASATGPGADISAMDGTVVNGGRAREGEGWADKLQRELANRYYTSVFCSWHATGGTLPGLLDRLPDEQLVLTNSINNTGNMFEKFSILDVDLSGYGGEYTVQAGFGWTNGVLLWVAATYGDVLVAPECPPLSILVSPLVVSAEADVVDDKDWRGMAGMVLVFLLGIVGQAFFF